MERRLAAILVADVVGYSTMMGTDEVRALASIRLLREALFEPEVARLRGLLPPFTHLGTSDATSRDRRLPHRG